MKETLFYNGHIHSLKNEHESFSCMVTSGKHITYLGNQIPTKKYKNKVDLEGKFVYPSFTDSHMHLLYTLVLDAQSFNICEINNEGVSPNTLEGIKEKLISYYEAHKKDSLIVGNNYIASAIKEGRLPNRFELDMWCHNKEVVILNIDGHSGSCSTSLLKKLGIFDESKDGILQNKEYDLSSDKITDYIASKISISSILDGFNAFQNDCIKYGISKVDALEGSDNGKNDFQLKLITFLARRMKIDVRLYPQYHNVEKCKKLFKKMTYPRVGGCSKWELDGSVGSHSASFYVPFIDTGSISDTYYKNEYVEQKMKEITSNNIQFTAHAIGTKAIDQITNSYKIIGKTNGFINRIDHFEFPSKNAIKIASDLHLAITVQPGFSYIDKRYLHSYDRYLPREVIDLQVPLKTCFHNGVYILGGSDSPVQSINPFLQMAGMIDFYIKEESLSNYEAIKTYTVYPSLVDNNANEGTLEVSKLANFIITKENLFNISADEMLNVKVEKLFKDGKLVKPSYSKLKALRCLLFSRPHKI